MRLASCGGPFSRVCLLHAPAAAGKEPMETENDPPKALQECEEKVKHLEEENEHLRDASHAFGQLAERLNTTLQRGTAGGRERPAPATALNGERRQSRESHAAAYAAYV